MLDSLPGFIDAYGIYLAGVAVILGVASYFSETFFKNMKKGLVIFVVIFGIIAGYELITGNDIFTLPGDVDESLSERPTESKGASNYYGKKRLDEAEKLGD